MKEAISLAKKAFLKDEVPVGALIIHSKTKEIIAKSYNLVEAKNNPLAHAEMLVIQKAIKSTGQKYLSDFDLYVTLEPCPLCASAISASRIGRVYFGAYDIKSGGVTHGARIFNASSCHHKPEVYGGIMELECQNLLTNFFNNKR